MSRRTGVAVYVLALVAVIVGVDVAFLRHRFWERLGVNIGVVLVFGMFYSWLHKRASRQASPRGDAHHPRSR